MATVTISKDEPSVNSYLAHELSEGFEVVPPPSKNAILWNVEVTVSGKKDADCQSLSFGFCQSLVEISIEAEWASGKKWQWAPSSKVPGRDRDDSDVVAPWYSGQLSPNGVKKCKESTRVSHIDRPGIGIIPWNEPGGAKLSLKQLAFLLVFDLFLVQKDKTGRFEVLKSRGWSINFRALVDTKQDIGKRVKIDSADNVKVLPKTKFKDLKHCKGKPVVLAPKSI
jgi:hypothetical protein